MFQQLPSAFQHLSSSRLDSCPSVLKYNKLSKFKKLRGTLRYFTWIYTTCRVLHERGVADGEPSRIECHEANQTLLVKCFFILQLCKECSWSCLISLPPMWSIKIPRFSSLWLWSWRACKIQPVPWEWCFRYELGPIGFDTQHKINRSRKGLRIKKSA